MGPAEVTIFVPGDGPGDVAGAVRLADIVKAAEPPTGCVAGHDGLSVARECRASRWSVVDCAVEAKLPERHHMTGAQAPQLKASMEMDEDGRW